MKDLTVNELIELASRTTCFDEMKFLVKNPSMNVRRALAKNVNASLEVLEKLQIDPVQNVSYMASLNPNINTSRNFEEVFRACVYCEENEAELNCVGCEHVAQHSF